MKTEEFAYTINELLSNDKLSPLPLEVIPNKMGINLCSVYGLKWTKQEDGQLISLSIYFLPENSKKGETK